MLSTIDSRTKALKGYVPHYPLTLTTLADYLYCNHEIWPICVGAGCGWRPPLDLAALIAKHGQDFPVTELMRRLKCGTCGGKAEVRITAGQNRN